MLIGYGSKKLQKICNEKKAARKVLSQESASRIFRRLQDLEAFDSLAEIPFRAPPLLFHALTEDRSGEYAIKIHGLDRICFCPVGDFTTDADGKVNLATVKAVEITFVGNYHDYG
ncbi:hypothetical protein [Rhodopirellula baltica]